MATLWLRPLPMLVLTPHLLQEGHNLKTALLFSREPRICVPYWTLKRSPIFGHSNDRGGAMCSVRYLEKVPQLLDLLRDAVTRDDAAAIFRIAHSLKSSSGNVGAMTLVELCKELEVMGRNQSTAEAPATFTAIAAEYAMVQEALAAELRKQPQSPGKEG
jgi:HPt (histidine-containing phosphotransfer) domain-containing protein